MTNVSGSYKTDMTVYVVTVRVHHVDHQHHCARWPHTILLNIGRAKFLEGNILLINIYGLFKKTCMAANYKIIGK
jgi:hypothetical protein